MLLRRISFVKPETRFVQRIRQLAENVDYTFEECKI